MTEQRRPAQHTPATFRLSLLAALAAACLVFCLIFADAATGASITVDSMLAVEPGACTLASAIAAAQIEADVEGCTWDGEAKVRLPVGTYRVAGEFSVTEDLEVRGDYPTATLIRDDPSVSHRFFSVDGADLILYGLTLDDGDDSSGGAAFVTPGSSLLIDSCTVSDNTSYNGGAIYNLGDLTVRRSTFSGNTANFSGGAIFSQGPTTIEISSFADNSANWGGAIYMGHALSGGDASAGTVTFSSFKDNVASYGGGTFHVESTASLQVSRSALVDGVGDLCQGAVTSADGDPTLAGNNIATDDSCGLTNASDLENADVALSDPVDHGGRTAVLVPREVCDANGENCKSLLLDHFDCSSECPSVGDCIHDQRGQTIRYNPLGSNGPTDLSYQATGPASGPTCDVGSYESSCNSAYWLDPVAKEDLNVRLYSIQTPTKPVIMDNGDCYEHPADFGPNASACTIRWEIWGGMLDVTDIHFITPTCALDCFDDPEGCKNACPASAPFGWSPLTDTGSDFQADISCDPGSFRYVIEYEELSNPGVKKFWDPEKRDQSNG